jgi:hypothetical protein
MSVCRSVFLHAKTRESLNEFVLNLILASVKLKFADTFKFWLRSDNNNGHFTWRSTRISALGSDWVVNPCVGNPHPDGRLRNSVGNPRLWHYWRHLRTLNHGEWASIVTLFFHFRTSFHICVAVPLVVGKILIIITTVIIIVIVHITARTVFWHKGNLQDFHYNNGWYKIRNWYVNILL